MAADGGYERDVVYRMNEGVLSVVSAEKCAEQERIVDKCEGVYVTQ